MFIQICYYRGGGVRRTTFCVYVASALRTRSSSSGSSNSSGSSRSREKEDPVWQIASNEYALSRGK